MKSRIVFFAFCLALLSSCGNKGNDTGKVPEYAVQELQKTTADLMKAYPATIKGRQDVEIRPQVSGFITKLCVDEGATVRKGQLLFIIDPTQYEAAVRTAKASVATAEAAVNTQQMTVDNKIELNKKQIISDYDLSMAKNSLAQAQAQLAQAKAQLTTAQQNYSFTQVKSPSDGVINDIPYRLGAAATQALRNGMSLHLLFEQLKEIRSEVQIPIILMGYLNPIMQYGFEKFCASCVEAGVDGMIIPDLPYADYISDYKEIADRHDLKMIMLITPETSEERIRQIDAHTSGFIYMVSSAATTGAQQDFNEQKQAYFRRINAMNLQNPRLVGFGISNKATFEAATAHSSGAIIGSKFVQLLKSEATPAEAVDKLLEALKQ